MDMNPNKIDCSLYVMENNEYKCPLHHGVFSIDYSESMAQTFKNVQQTESFMNTSPEGISWQETPKNPGLS